MSIFLPVISQFFQISSFLQRRLVLGVFPFKYQFFSCIVNVMTTEMIFLWKTQMIPQYMVYTKDTYYRALPAQTEETTKANLQLPVIL